MRTRKTAICSAITVSASVAASDLDVGTRAPYSRMDLTSIAGARLAWIERLRF